MQTPAIAAWDLFNAHTHTHTHCSFFIAEGKNCVDATRGGVSILTERPLALTAGREAPADVYYIFFFV